MKVLKEIIFSIVLVVGLSITVSAQKNNDQKKPPKGPPPVVTPAQKPKPRETPPRNSGDRGGKKPGMSLLLILRQNMSEIA